jgi:WD40 repeat protein
VPTAISIPAAHVGGVTSLAVSPWGDLFASGGADGQVRFWSLPEGRRLGELPHGGPIRSVVFRPATPGDARPAGHLLASAGDDGRVRLWDWSSWAGWRFLGAAAILPGHAAPPRVVFSPDGRRLLSWSADGTSRLWDRAEGRMLRQLDRNEKGVAVTAGRFSADGSQVATVSADGTVRIWKAAAGDEGPVRTVRCEAGLFHAADVSPDLAGLAVVGPPKPDVGSLVRLWSLTSGAEGEPFVGRGGPLHAVTFSPDGRLLAVCEHAGVHIWETATRRALPRSGFGHSLVEELQFADDRGGVLALRSNEALMRLQETATGRELAAIPVAGGFAYHASGLAAGVGPGSRVELRDRTGRMLAATAEPVGSRPTLSPDGRYLAAGGPDGSVRVWDLSAIPRGGR